MDPVDSIIRIDVKMKHEINKKFYNRMYFWVKQDIQQEKKIIWVLILFIVNYIKIKWK